MAKSKVASHMTRIVIIGELDSYDMNDAGNMGKGYLKVGDAKVQFVIFNNDKEGAANPHTKATDFDKLYQKGDKVFITGTDARNYSEEKDQYYEGVQVWDYRKGLDNEPNRWVFVYVGDVAELEDEEAKLSFINYKDEEMIFPLNLQGCKVEGELTVGSRIKVKGELFSGFKMDFYGDGEYVTERNVVEVKVLNSKEELEEDAAGTSEENGMWD